ncbi:GAF domain-containing protein [Fulvivirga sp. RKSG066]|uniref:ATP-binding protein n=1 Tax=Fulvivirga aurantia TaxID=2529383 RepID=UPI0012BBD7ED|nr:ATP-binding protein [Fulvivirga aurantia]MTI21766.1 GAF domain-containing protein [Fulvivirga aurantia]
MQKEQFIDCENEPIHIPGQIQSNGHLIGLDNKSLNVLYLSDNFNDILSVDAILGTSVRELDQALNISPASLEDILKASKAGATYENNNPYRIVIGEELYYLIISPSGEDKILLELERIEQSKPEVDTELLLGKSVVEIQNNNSINGMMQTLANQIREVIGYDRVMVYRFWEDWHGEVIAEDKRSDLEAYLGLHYPASDIPPQARELYKKNLTRIISNVNDAPVDILSKSKEPIDLSFAEMRAISPVHIQYLKNMGVTSSFSISLLKNGELWGLIACHNYSPKHIDYMTRKAGKLISQLFSTALSYKSDNESLVLEKKYEHCLDSLNLQMEHRLDVKMGLFDNDVTLLDINSAHGAALVFDGKIHTTGSTPSHDQIKALSQWLKSEKPHKVYKTSSISKHYKDGIDFKDVGSGILAAVISHELMEYIIWFKPEKIKEVSWAGKPEKILEVDEKGVKKLTPRASFDEWRETVTNQSDSWTNLEVETADKLIDQVNYVITKKANEIRKLNEQLSRAYDELDTFSYTISHDLKTPLTAMIGFLDVFMMMNEDIEASQLDYLQRAKRNAEKMTGMIQDILEYSKIRGEIQDSTSIDMTELIKEIANDLESKYAEKDVQIRCNSSLIPLQGNRVMINQVFSNLLDNGIKYSDGKVPEIVIDSEKNDKEVIYSIKDNGIGMQESESDKIFNLFYRLKDTSEIEGSGVGLAIVKRIVEKHNGRIWVKSKPKHGTTFYLAFPSR